MINTLPASDYSVNDPAVPARFRVTPDVIIPGLEPFTATTSDQIGHTFLRSGLLGFEPVEFRNRFSDSADGDELHRGGSGGID